MAFHKYSYSCYILSILCLAGCSQKIVHFVNSRATFDQYSTYSIVNFKTSNATLSKEGEQVLTVIESEISNQLNRRDYKKNSKAPNLVARYELISNQVTKSLQTNDPFTYNYSRFSSFNIRTYLESALLIELYDASTKKLIWQASLDLNKYSKRNNKEEILSDAISKLFNTYLYRANSSNPDESLISEK